MIVVQRVRVRWDSDSRGAPAANARRGLPERHPLPSPLPDADIVVHDILADVGTGYRPDARTLVGAKAAEQASLRLALVDDQLVVHRLPGWASYPARPRHPRRLFALLPGQIGRYRANFRFTGCQCAARWWYEQWTVHVARGPDGFAAPAVDHDVDDRVHLYGGRGRP
ncbi:hypothetical protein GCM10009682_56040 [Luedemannella flava]|uniref:Uncharacterized protein n=1 Tax=Luedemannella flava TaxID=349316 RepID=A0ABP4YU03_9ACTN